MFFDFSVLKYLTISILVMKLFLLFFAIVMCLRAIDANPISGDPNRYDQYSDRDNIRDGVKRSAAGKDRGDRDSNGKERADRNGAVKRGWGDIAVAWG